MSHLTSIEGAGFKGANFQYDLQPLTVVTGGNFSGKSRILDAIRVLLLGYHPQLGKTGTATFELSNGSSMSVSGRFADGAVVTRGWGLKKGTVTQTVGDKEPIVPAMLLDANEYFTLSGKERLRYVIERADVGDKWTDEVILSEIANAITKGIKTVTPAHESARAIIDGNIHALVGCRREEEVPMTVFIQSLRDSVAEQLTAATATSKRLAGSVQTAAVQGSGDAPINPNAETEWAETRAKVDALMEKIAALAVAADVAPWLKTKKAIEALMVKVFQVPPVAPIEAKIAKLEKAKPFDAAKLTALREKRATLSANISTFTVSLASLGDTMKQLNKRMTDAAKAVCPCCGNTGTNCPATAKVMASLTGDKLACQNGVDAAEARVKTDEELLAAEDKKLAPLLEKQMEEQKNKEALARLKLDLFKAQTACKEQADISRQLDEHGELGPPPDTTTLDAAKAEKFKLEVVLSSLNADIKRAAAAKQDQFRREQSRQEQLEVSAEIELLKIVGTAVQDIQTRMMAEAFDGLLVKANRFTDGILLSPLAYHDDDMGRWDKSTFIRHRTFTRTEERLSYAGLSVALASDAKHKIVLFDEWLLDEGNRVKCIERLRLLLKEKYIDQVILADIDAAPYAGLLTKDDQLISLMITFTMKFQEFEGKGTLISMEQKDDQSTQGEIEKANYVMPAVKQLVAMLIMKTGPVSMVSGPDTELTHAAVRAMVKGYKPEGGQ